MATVRLSANHAISRNNGGGFNVVFHLDGRADVLPQKLVEVRTTAEAFAALEAFKDEAARTGQPCAVSMRLIKGRAPNGFKTAMEGNFYHGLNV